MASPENVLKCLELLLGDRVQVNERTLLEGVAELYLQLDRAPEGILCLVEAKNLHRQLYDWRGDARVLRKLGRVQFERGDKLEAARLWQQAVHASKEVDDLEGEVLALDLIAGSMAEDKRYDEAAPVFENVLQLRRRNGARRAEAATLQRLSVCYTALGRSTDALQTSRQALTIWREENEADQVRACLQQIASSFLSEGRFDDLVRAGTELLDMIEESGLKTGRARVYMDIGAACRTLGRHKEALTAFRKALDMATEEADPPGRIHALLSLGKGLRERGVYTDAIKVLRQAETDAKEGAVRPMTGHVLLELGITCWAQGLMPDAQKTLAEAARTLKSAGQPERAARAYLYLSGLALQTPSFKDAEAHLVVAHGLVQGTRDADMLAAVYVARGFVMWTQGRTRQALQWLRSGLSMQIEPEAAIESVDRLLLGPLIDPFEGLVDLSLQAGDSLQAARVMQKAHARAVLARMALLQLEDGPGERLLSEIRGNLARLSQMYDAASRSAMREQIYEMRSRLTRQQATWEDEQPGYAVLRSEPSLELSDIQNLLEADTAMLLYFVGLQRTYLIVVTKEVVAPFVFHVTQADLSQRVFDLVAAVRNQEKHETVVEQSRLVTDAVLSPALPLLSTCENLVIVPQDVLYDLPFCLLLGEDEQFLNHRFTVTAASSAAIWRFCVHRSQRRGPVSRRPTRAEVRERLALVRTRTVVEEEEPTADLVEIAEDTPADVFDRDGRKAQWLHLSAPLELAAETPFSTEFRLAGQKLTLHALASRSYQARLALLSASTTDQTSRLSGDVWISLIMTLAYAGIPCTVLSQWPVPDDAQAQLAGTLFRELQKGTPRAQALRAAQHHVAKHKKLSHPFFWAAFAMYGDGR